MRLIDADLLWASSLKATDSNDFAFNNCFPYWQFAKCVKDAPTVDAVEVVRCKDCMWFDKTKYVYNCEINKMQECQPDDYCPYGDRKR